MKHLYKKMLVLAIVLCSFCNNPSAQADTTKSSQDISTFSFKKIFSTAVIFDQASTPYIYKRPTNELMVWPNYPLTAAQIEAKDKQVVENRKILPLIADQLITSWINGKKQKPIAVLPQF